MYKEHFTEAKPEGKMGRGSPICKKVQGVLEWAACTFGNINAERYCIWGRNDSTHHLVQTFFQSVALQPNSKTFFSFNFLSLNISFHLLSSVFNYILHMVSTFFGTGVVLNRNKLGYSKVINYY